MGIEALVDGDILPYKCGFATQQSEYETEDGVFHATPTAAKKHIEDNGLKDHIEVYVEAEPLNHALRLCKNLLSRVETATKCTDMRIFLSGATNFREKIATIRPYKGNRTQAKPLHFDAIRKYLIDKRGAEVTDGIEADDALGINQQPGGLTVICTIDKDLNMVPGLHYNWDTNAHFNVTPWEGLVNFYHQVLTGDSTDNIQGCPGIGKVKAGEILTGMRTELELYSATWHAYQRAFDHDSKKADAAMLENAQLLYIQQKPGDIWLPPTKRA